MITYIVTTERGYWGKGDRLEDALESAHLVVPTPTDFFAESLQYADELGPGLDEAAKDWKDYARYDMKSEMEEETRCHIYKFDDDEYWEDFEISHMHGSVTFQLKEGIDIPQSVVNKLFEKCHVRAVWKAGVLRRDAS